MRKRKPGMHARVAATLAAYLDISPGSSSEGMKETLGSASARNATCCPVPVLANSSDRRPHCTHPALQRQVTSREHKG